MPRPEMIACRNEEKQKHPRTKNRQPGCILHKLRASKGEDSVPCFIGRHGPSPDQEIHCTGAQPLFFDSGLPETQQAPTDLPTRNETTQSSIHQSALSARRSTYENYDRKHSRSVPAHPAPSSPACPHALRKYPVAIRCVRTPDTFES